MLYAKLYNKNPLKQANIINFNKEQNKLIIGFIDHFNKNYNTNFLKLLIFHRLNKN